MKRLLLIVLLCIALSGLVGCGKQDNAVEANANKVAAAFAGGDMAAENKNDLTEHDDTQLTQPVGNLAQGDQGDNTRAYGEYTVQGYYPGVEECYITFSEANIEEREVMVREYGSGSGGGGTPLEEYKSTRVTFIILANNSDITVPYNAHAENDPYYSQAVCGGAGEIIDLNHYELEWSGSVSGFTSGSANDIIPWDNYFLLLETNQFNTDYCFIMLEPLPNPQSETRAEMEVLPVQKDDRSAYVTGYDGFPVIYDYFYEYVLLSGGPNASKINDVILGKKEAFFAKEKELGLASEDIDKIGYGLTRDIGGDTYGLALNNVNVEDIFLSDRFFSVNLVHAPFFGTGSGYYCIGYTFDLETGEIITLPELLGLGLDETKELVLSKVKEFTGDNYEANLTEPAVQNSSAANFGFCIKDDGKVYLLFNKNQFTSGPIFGEMVLDAQIDFGNKIYGYERQF